MKRRRFVAIAVLVVLVGFVAVNELTAGPGRTSMSVTEFENALADKDVAEAELLDRDNEIKGELKNGTRFAVKFPGEYGDEITQKVLDAKVDLPVDNQKNNVWFALVLNLLPFLIIIGMIFFFMSRVQGGGRGVMGFGKSRAKLMSVDKPKLTFADVAGLDEAIEELKEIRDFLAAPSRFEQMGAKIPRGVLLFGPPGTGKTLLARAVAGEAGVPFFSISGSDFVEMFVGVGASRVRDLFERAKSAAPAIIFVDEIDAVGRHRGAGLGGGHDEREQTLNQLLVEMDGFDQRQGVILVAATNRPDILDPALLRPGRFDRQIVVDRPDVEGRRAILDIHAREKPLAEGVDLAVIARRTPGFTGADLANLMNEATLLAARRGLARVGHAQFEEAIDRVMAGPERRSRIISDKEKRVIAYHEGGHALVGHALPNADPVHKISIIPRGRALGYTLTLPTEDRYLVARSELVDQLAMLLGGRTAEELIFADPTTGAANDIEKATTTARAMVTQFGMSEAVGPVRLGQPQGEVFLGRDFGTTPDYSDAVAAQIDEEIRLLVDNAHQTALAILTTHRDVLDALADKLVERETLDTDEAMKILKAVPKWDSLTTGRPAVVASDPGDHPAPGPARPFGAAH
ncbi:MAG TPA: ATP-dependent zinc metalloprotease FtsH [Acidimicrobiia bacterium]|nr:ATP-dependent zinc metalloprotease FtsH [Acidimicrobiia bacterium]